MRGNGFHIGKSIKHFRYICEGLQVNVVYNLLFCYALSDDSFVTPPSTPPVEEDGEFMSITDSTDALVNEISCETLADMMYER